VGHGRECNKLSLAVTNFGRDRGAIPDFIGDNVSRVSSNNIVLYW
jgi:hypothetical protein